MKKADHSQCDKCLAYQVALQVIARSVAKLWQSVAGGMHDARSLVGDETLSMKETLEDVGILLPLDTLTDKKTTE